jgi:hypothetical protein
MPGPLVAGHCFLLEPADDGQKTIDMRRLSCILIEDQQDEQFVHFTSGA